MITVFEYLQVTQAWVVDKLKQAGLLAVDYTPRKQNKPEITFADTVTLLRMSALNIICLIALV